MEFYPFHSLWFCSLMMVTWGAEEIQVNLQMREETPPFTKIGSITSSLPADLGTKLHFLTDSSFFSITPSGGEVRVARLIDREHLCPEFKLCCGVLACQLDARVFVTNRLTGEFAASVNLKVDLQDQNDNRPKFSSAVQKVSISETTPVGTYVNLVPAMDADIDPANQIQRYTLTEPTGTFVLDLTELPLVRLQLTRSLDRERVASYTATLEACDPGACARQSLEVHVLDENDNKPIFEILSYTERLMENIKVGEVVLNLNATDADSGDRGRIIYSLYGTVDPDLLETFELVKDTGEIRLKRALAANIRDSYWFKVVACDAVNPSCSGDENSTVEVTLLVEDVNNFAPSIHVVAAGVTLVSAGSQTGESTSYVDSVPGGDSTLGDGLSILENTQPSQVAVLTVRDADLGENARVHCSLNDTKNNPLVGGSTPDFVLTLIAPGIYSLRTARMFDHEIEPSVAVKVVCHDFGKPHRLTSARMIVVKVIDVNEYQPEFSRRVYAGRVPENAPAGMEILTTTATDRDRAAALHYQFAPSSVQQINWNPDNIHLDSHSKKNWDVNKHFVIEADTGVMRTSQIPLDRELISSLTLTVLVTDSKLPPIFTASTTVTVDVLDGNDNAPIFINPPSESITSASENKDRLASKAFTVIENSPRFTRLSEQLEAHDPDQGDNGRVHFSLLKTYALTRTNIHSHLSSNAIGRTYGEPEVDATDEPGLSRKVVDQPIFRITLDGGIQTLVELDRESVAAYLLKIGVQDRGAQPLATSTMLRVDVLDANDNAPVWVFPTLTDRTINLTTAMKPGSLAGRLRAEDADAAEAGKVEYMFLGPRGEPIRGLSMREGLLNSLTLNDEDGQDAKLISLQTVTQSSMNLPNENGYRIGPLYLNGSTGEIWITQTLTSGAINLHLRAKDRGTPSSQTDAWLTVNVFVDPSDDPGFFNFGGDGTLNITIILVMIAITAIVSLFLIVGIVCVRRRPTRYSSSRGNLHIDGPINPGNAASPYPFDGNKENMAAAIAAGSWQTPTGIYATGQYYPSQGSIGGPMMEDSQMFTALGSPGVMGYGAIVAPSDTASLIYVPHPHSMSGAISPMNGGSITPVPIDHGLIPVEYAGSSQMHTFGTLTRNRSSFTGGYYPGTTGGAPAYEPHLDADSGDSGRGPSEEGNQFLISENYRAGVNSSTPSGGYPYNTYAGYRPSTRASLRTTTFMDDTMKLHSLACSTAGCGGGCGCYFVPEHQMVYPPGHFTQAYVSNDYNPTSHINPQAGLVMSSPHVPLLPPRSPVTYSADNEDVQNIHVVDMKTRELPIPNECTENYSQVSNKNFPMKDQVQKIDPGGPKQPSNNNGDLGTDMEIKRHITNGTMTPLRLDLRNSTRIHPEANEDVGHRAKHGSRPTDTGPALPPLANRKVSINSKSSMDSSLYTENPA